MIFKLKTIFYFFLLSSILFSCKKQDYEDGFVTFADIYFINNSVLGEDLGIKYNGEPIEWAWSTTGKIKTVKGEGKFEFYKKSSGTILAEKIYDVTELSQRYLIFQPESDAPISILDPNSQENESAPDKGYMKIKIANYSPVLLPFEKIDIIVWGLGDNGLEELDVIESVGRNLDEEVYHLVNRGTADIVAYRFSFRDSATKEKILNARGTEYISFVYLEPGTIQPFPEKHVFTMYLTPEFYGPDMPTSRLQIGDDFYDVNPAVLFSN